MGQAEKEDQSELDGGDSAVLPVNVRTTGITHHEKEEESGVKAGVNSDQCHLFKSPLVPLLELHNYAQ